MSGLLPLANLKMDSVYHGENTERTYTSCTWYGTATPREPAERIDWYLTFGDGGARDATAAQRALFAGELPQGSRATVVGFGDEAYWLTSTAEMDDITCGLAVRDGNLSVKVILRGPQHPPATCEADAKRLARTAWDEVPR
ncbi:hypothetical protein [Streptomyces sp. NPDC090022]|uniref:hypothetical protein n=1 Tax=Streptomyces sp. NPDC090022 TaxID=3365920 RepID=UPI00382FC2CF